MVYYADQEHPRKRLKLWNKSEATLISGKMEDFNSETDSDYTSYWRDWVGSLFLLVFYIFDCFLFARCELSSTQVKILLDGCGSCWTGFDTAVLDDRSDCEILGANPYKTKGVLGSSWVSTIALSLVSSCSLDV